MIWASVKVIWNKETSKQTFYPTVLDTDFWKCSITILSMFFINYKASSHVGLPAL